MKSLDIAEEQINNEGVTVHLYSNDVAVSTASTGTKPVKKANLFPAGGALRTSGCIKTAEGNALPANGLGLGANRRGPVTQENGYD